MSQSEGASVGLICRRPCSGRQGRARGFVTWMCAICASAAHHPSRYATFRPPQVRQPPMPPLAHRVQPVSPVQDCMFRGSYVARALSQGLPTAPASNSCLPADGRVHGPAAGSASATGGQPCSHSASRGVGSCPSERHTGRAIGGVLGPAHQRLAENR